MALTTAPPEPSIIDFSQRGIDMRALWRLFAWGGAAAIALAAVAITSQTESGAARIRSAIAHATEPVLAMATAPVPKQTVERVIVDNAETRRLASEVRSLTADRDRLAARVAGLEHSLDDITGSIQRQAEQAAAAKTAEVPAPPPSKPDAPAAAIVPPALGPLAMPLATETAAAWPDGAQAQAAAPASDDVPLPPAKTASVVINEPNPAPPVPAKPEFGIALAGATSVEITRMQWAAVKANFGPLLAGLHPRAMHEPRNGAAHYRLVVGPLPTHTAAAKLCARMIAAHAICNPVKFLGEPL
jgi:hypothetical protein